MCVDFRICLVMYVVLVRVLCTVSVVNVEFHSPSGQISLSGANYFYRWSYHGNYTTLRLIYNIVTVKRCPCVGLAMFL